MEGTDARGRRRGIEFPLSTIEHAWEHLAPTSVSLLSVDAAIWPALNTFPTCTSMRRLAVTLDLARLLDPCSDSARFSVLTLVLKNPQRDGSQTHVLAGDVVALVRQIRGVGLVEELRLEGVEIEGDPRCLKDIVKTLTRDPRTTSITGL